MAVKKKLLLPDLNEQFLIYSSGCQSLISWNLWFYLLQILHANNAGISYYHIKHWELPLNQNKPAATVKQGRETHAIARIHYFGILHKRKSSAISVKEGESAAQMLTVMATWLEW